MWDEGLVLQLLRIPELNPCLFQLRKIFQQILSDGFFNFFKIHILQNRSCFGYKKTRTYCVKKFVQLLYKNADKDFTKKQVRNSMNLHENTTGA